MSLYTPSHFKAGDPAAVARLIDDEPFATLITPNDPEPAVSHVPLLLETGSGEPAHGTLVGHFARANPHWQHAQRAESIAIFHGPHAYVSPSWYAEPAKAVPTWNYVTVHALGTLEVITDPLLTRAVLDRLVRRFEGTREAPWTLALGDRERDAMIGAIVAFRMPIRRLDAKFKLSQNRSTADRERVIGGLAAEPWPEANATADWMRRYALPATHGDDAKA